MAKALDEARIGGAAEAAASSRKQVWADCDPDRSSLGSYGWEALHQATPSRSGAAQSAAPAGAGKVAPAAQAEWVPEQANVENPGGEQTAERRGGSKGKLFDDAENPLKIKNTFFHIDLDPSIFEDAEARKMRQLESAPADLLDHEWHTKFPSMEEAHAKGECKPCAYYVYKRDGCRQGERCPFCHLCTRGEIKRRKKKMVEQRRLEEQVDRADDVDGEACVDGLPNGTASESVVGGTSSVPLDGMGSASSAPVSATAAKPGKSASRPSKAGSSAREAAAAASAAPSQPSGRRPPEQGASHVAPAQGLFDAFGRPVMQPPGFGPAAGDVFAAFAGASWRAQDDDDDFGYARPPAYVPAWVPPAPFVRAAPH